MYRLGELSENEVVKHVLEPSLQVLYRLASHQARSQKRYVIKKLMVVRVVCIERIAEVEAGINASTSQGPCVRACLSSTQSARVP